MQELHQWTESFVLFYLDEILIARKNWPDLKVKLILVLDGIKKEGITPIESKVKATLEYLRSSNVHDLRRLLGLFGFLRRFIYQFASIADPLFALLKEGICFQME